MPNLENHGTVFAQPRALAIKNWSRFQHFNKRRPPWIKLYRTLLDDIQWHELDPVASKALVMLWLIASEFEGKLPSIRALAFRMRMSEEAIGSILSQLSHWLVENDIETISDCYHGDAPETETDIEKEKEKEKERKTERVARASSKAPPDGFEEWYDAYPKHVGRGGALKAYVGALKKIDAKTLLAAAKRASGDYFTTELKFIPMPETWLNQERWLDERAKPYRVKDDPIYRGVL